MSDWISLHPEQVSKEMRQTRRQDGVHISVSVSPYDVPDAVRGMFDRSIDRFLIEFRYLSQEEWSRRKHDDYISLRVGKNSERIYGIEIDVKGLQAKAVGLRVQLAKLVNRAIDDELADVPGSQPRQANYELAKSVISDRRESLFGDLVGV